MYTTQKSASTCLPILFKNSYIHGTTHYEPILVFTVQCTTEENLVYAEIWWSMNIIYS